MNNKIVLSAKLNFLVDYAKKQYNQNKGLHLNSKDWKAFITISSPLYYSFLINGTIKWHTDSAISGERYNQFMKLKDFKKIEAPLLILFLLNIDESNIIKFISEFLLEGETKLYCPCKAFLYWGHAYNLTKINSKYGEPENIPPDIRDKRRNNLVCKHLWLILMSYSEQINKFASGLLPYYRRMFGLNTDASIERTKKELGQKGIRFVIAQTNKDLIKINNTNLTNLFHNLTDNKINNIFNTKIDIKPTKDLKNENEIEKKEPTEEEIRDVSKNTKEEAIEELKDIATKNLPDINKMTSEEKNKYIDEKRKETSNNNDKNYLTLNKKFKEKNILSNNIIAPKDLEDFLN